MMRLECWHHSMDSRCRILGVWMDRLMWTVYESGYEKCYRDLSYRMKSLVESDPEVDEAVVGAGDVREAQDVDDIYIYIYMCGVYMGGLMEDRWIWHIMCTEHIGSE